jgi:hypothetical protein
VAGTGLASVGLSLGGYVGLAATLVLISGVALALLLVARRSLAAPAPAAEEAIAPA